MAQAMELDFLYFVPRLFVYIALPAWAAAFVGLISTLLRGLVEFVKKASASAA
jgi:hypothetical protein